MSAIVGAFLKAASQNSGIPLISKIVKIQHQQLKILFKFKRKRNFILLISFTSVTNSFY